MYRILTLNCNFLTFRAFIFSLYVCVFLLCQESFDMILATNPSYQMGVSQLGLMVKKFLVHSSNNAFSHHNLETTCHLWDYEIAYEYFLVKVDLIQMLYLNIYGCFVSAQW
jgi:hypothetical protein